MKRQFPPGVQLDCLDYAVHFLFDDTRLAEAPERTIGVFLKSSREMQAVSDLVRALDGVFTRHGTGLSDGQYLQLPDWGNVVRAARPVHDLLIQDDDLDAAV